MPGMNPDTGRWTQDGEEIAVAVRKAMTTPKASRVMRRWLGVRNAELLDRPIEPAMVGPMTVAVAESLAAEPRVVLRRMGLTSATQQGAAQIAAEVAIIGTDKTMKVM